MRGRRWVAIRHPTMVFMIPFGRCVREGDGVGVGENAKALGELEWW